MSGGSFNYLSSAYSLDDLLGKEESLRQMVEELKRTPGAQDAYLEALALIQLLDKSSDEIMRIHASLGPVFHAVEWVCSGDWGPERLIDALDGWRQQKRLPETHEVREYADGWRVIDRVSPGVRTDTPHQDPKSAVDDWLENEGASPHATRNHQ